MRRLFILALLLIFLTACNLTQQPAGLISPIPNRTLTPVGGRTLQPTAAQTTPDPNSGGATPTRLPGIVLTPNTSGGATPNPGAGQTIVPTIGVSVSSQYGSITSPTSGTTVDGNNLQITGTAGNFPGGTFTLALLDEGEVVATQQVTISGADAQLVPWSATLNTSRTGQMELVAFVPGSPRATQIASIQLTLQ